MSDDELLVLLNDIESDRVERKESASDGNKVRQVVCAFANDLPDHRKPGVLFIGVRDDGVPIGLAITDQLLQNLASLRNEGKILPFPSVDVQKRCLKGFDVAVVLVHPSSAPPVRLDGTVCVRSGPRRATATPDDERRLVEKRRFKDTPPDIMPVEGATLDALDVELFRQSYLPAALSQEVLAQNRRSVEHQLTAVRFVRSDPPSVPTVLGLLTVGHSLTDWIPGAYLQFVRFDGENFTSPVRQSTRIAWPITRPAFGHR